MKALSSSESTSGFLSQSTRYNSKPATSGRQVAAPLARRAVAQRATDALDLQARVRVCKMRSDKCQ
jgi:hypothetical protein